MVRFSAAGLALALLAGLLAGCSTAPQMPTIVKVPAATGCEIAPIERPERPLAKLAKDAPDGVTAATYEAEVETLKGYAKQLEKLLDGCRADKSIEPIPGIAPIPKPSSWNIFKSFGGSDAARDH